MGREGKGEEREEVEGFGAVQKRGDQRGREGRGAVQWGRERRALDDFLEAGGEERVARHIVENLRLSVGISEAGAEQVDDVRVLRRLRGAHVEGLAKQP